MIHKQNKTKKQK